MASYPKRRWPGNGRRPTCRCGKKCFDSKTDALHSARKVGNNVRAYQCRKSGKWHFTRVIDPNDLVIDPELQ